ncbi:MAG: hypothetical protein AAF431_12470 [Pseudomonadota bacterium]
MIPPIDNSNQTSHEASLSIRGVSGFAFGLCVYGAILFVGLRDWLFLDGPITLGVCIFLMAWIDLSYRGIKSSVTSFDESAKDSNILLTAIFLIFDFREKENAKELGQTIGWTLLFGFLCIAYITKLIEGKLTLTQSSLHILSAIPIYVVTRYAVIYLWKRCTQSRDEA